MRTLVVGAGGVGGYFGGRLLHAGRDVTFLVRESRAQQLQESGLSIRSALGDVHVPNPPTVQAASLRQAYDLVLLSCKSYDLEAAIDSFAPAVGPGTVILPLLNGMRHMDALDERFGANAVFGGQCLISAALGNGGAILHLNSMHSLSFGERSGARTARAEAVLAEFSGARFEARLSDAILQEMWEKWTFIAALAGITCLMRASIGDIVAAGGVGLSDKLYTECAEIATRAGFAPREESERRSRSNLTAAGSPLAASMLRDIERGARTEVEHILGELLRRREIPAHDVSLLHVAYAHIKAHEARQAREASA